MHAAISIDNVSKSYLEGGRAEPVLRAINLEVELGQMLMLVGPSGSGKTTLLSIMGCLLHPTSGSVRIEGREVTHASEQELAGVRLRKLGFVFQGFNLFPALTARENVELALDLQQVRGPAAHERANRLLEQVGLVHQSGLFPEALSMGQKQRVAIARALAGDPNIILADEPTASLDAHSGRMVLELLRALALDQRRAMVVVTHDSRALEFADRIVHLQNGRLEEKRLAPLPPAAAVRQGEAKAG